MKLKLRRYCVTHQYVSLYWVLCTQVRSFIFFQFTERQTADRHIVELYIYLNIILYCRLPNQLA
jgi:hypothetical protein